MAHHKRGKPKSSRAGCMLCKPHKRQGSPKDCRQVHADAKRMKITEEKIKEVT